MEGMLSKPGVNLDIDCKRKWDSLPNRTTTYQENVDSLNRVFRNEELISRINTGSLSRVGTIGVLDLQQAGCANQRCPALQAHDEYKTTTIRT